MIIETERLFLREMNENDYNVLYSYMKADNAASVATAKSVGMHKSGEYVDAEQELTSVYALER